MIVEVWIAVAGGGGAISVTTRRYCRARFQITRDTAPLVDASTASIYRDSIGGDAGAGERRALAGAGGL